MNQLSLGLKKILSSPWIAPGVVILSLLALAWSSSLSFFPIPWSDDSVYLLTGAELVSWPPRFRMLSQSMVVPSYLDANFNNMPLLPLVIGFFYRLGFETVHAFRLLGLAVFGIWCLGLMVWMRGLRIRNLTAWLLMLGALTSPVLRWCAMPVHPETWVGLFWLLILMEFTRRSGKPSLWKIAGYLALSAGFHFQAIVWVPPVALALFPMNETGSFRKMILLWLRQNLNLAWRVLFFMGPWLFYVFWNREDFVSQMKTQFGRLVTAHPFMTSWHGFFHSLFMKTGNPVDYPKFYNLGKFILWGFLLIALVQVIRQVVKGNPKLRPAFVASLAAVVMSFLLWVDKPETWFVQLIHMSLFPLFALALSETHHATGLRARSVAWGIRILAVTLIGVQVGVAVHQWRGSRAYYSWSRFENWVQCIHETLGDREKVWLPSSLDPLIDLYGKDPGKLLWGHNCFRDPGGLLDRHVGNMTAVIHTIALAPDDPLAGLNYSGPARMEDFRKLEEDRWLQYKNYSAMKMGKPWTSSVCQSGPFWAVISLR